jgi:hypothetical protein
MAAGTARNQPTPLASFGMPGCDQWIGPAAALLLLANGNRAVWTLAIPWTAALQGTELAQQALVLDPGANAAGLTVTNAARCRIGL